MKSNPWDLVNEVSNERADAHAKKVVAALRGAAARADVRATKEYKESLAHQEARAMALLLADVLELLLPPAPKKKKRMSR